MPKSKQFMTEFKTIIYNDLFHGSLYEHTNMFM